MQAKKKKSPLIRRHFSTFSGRPVLEVWKFTAFAKLSSSNWRRNQLGNYTKFCERTERRGDAGRDQLGGGRGLHYSCVVKGGRDGVAGGVRIREGRREEESRRGREKGEESRRRERTGEGGRK